MENLSSKYNPQEIEDKWYAFWEENQFFHAQNISPKKTYTVMIPPPNVTSVLHMGHGLNNTLQDVMVRLKRMQGYNTLWMPGTDHAGIATQNVVERVLAKEGKKRQDFTREEFLKKVWDWKNEYGSAIINQLKKIGCSCDWERESFTMDESLSLAVREAFVKLYEDGLIYKGEYMVNWCPRCGTALSDEEVEHKTESSFLYHIKYYLKDSQDYLVVATVRPETLLGDVAVAVNPQDKRYQKFIGKTVILPFLKKEIPVIADSYVETDFGTGVLKITPAHDPNDFEIGLKHKLPLINILTPEGKMNSLAGDYQGLDRFEARKKIIKDLKALNLLEKEEPYEKSAGQCYRCDTVIEPYVSAQWFVKMKPLAQKAKEVVEKNEVQLIPHQFKKTYFHWMDNIKDWCISRQIWWGHRIPAWYCQECKKITVARETPSQCQHCQSNHIQQDDDVLDTWFSSWLWPFSTLGWPLETKDLQTFYPTQFLSTAPEILFFWVARMIMAGLYFKNQIPFSQVYLHSTVCDSQGIKMSKSLGNGIDPLEVVKEYGADSLRFTILYLAPVGQRIRLAKNSFDIGFRFANKLWNASRLILMNADNVNIKPLKELSLNLWDQWILKELNTVIKNTLQDLENFRFNDVVENLYHFIWSRFCDWYLEIVKTSLYSQDKKEKQRALSVLFYVLEKSLRLLHPIMPFITEEIWQKLPNHQGKTIMLAPFPQEQELHFEDPTPLVESIQELIYLVRNIRGDMGVTPDKKVSVIITSLDKSLCSLFLNHQEEIKILAKILDMQIEEQILKPQKSVSAVGKGFEVFVKLEGMVDFEKEKARIKKDLLKIQKDLDLTQKKLNNPQYLEKAPQGVVLKEKEKEEELLEKVKKLKQLQESLQN